MATTYIEVLLFIFTEIHLIDTSEPPVLGTGDTKVWAPLSRISDALTIVTGALGAAPAERDSEAGEEGWGEESGQDGTVKPGLVLANV